MSNLLSGKEVVNVLNEELITKRKSLEAQGINPCLAIVRVGENPSDISYEKMATTRGEKIGIKIKKYAFEEKAKEEEIIELIENINEDNTIHGVLIFRPLPKHISDEKIRGLLNPAKDIDGITPTSMANVYSGGKFGFSPCTPKACMEILKRNNIELSGKKAVIVGRSLVVGKPLAMMLLEENATVTICHSKTKDIEQICRNADILIAAIGKAKAISSKYVNENQVVIDVGINLDNEGNLCGDVDFLEVENHVKAITPVPGGVGTVTTSILMDNVIRIAGKKNE